MVQLTSAEWILLLIGMSVVTVASRLLPVLVVGKRRLPVKLQKALALVPCAVLAAAVAPAILMPSGHLNLSFSNVFLIAAGPTFLAALFSSNLLVPVSVGLVTVSVFRALVF